MTLLETAQQYIAAGLCTLPADKVRKFPTVGKWGKYQKRMPSEAELAAWFANNPDGLCILCGRASGNTEIIDFDQHAALFPAWAVGVPVDLLSRLVIETTQSGGKHAVYRCETEICGNLKLAQRKVDDEITTLIETRGQGGLFLCDPTPGYELVQGELTTLPVLTTAEREILLQAAADLDETDDNSPSKKNPSPPIPTCPHTSPPVPSNPFANRPGDDFNQRGDIRPILKNHGWTYLRQDSENEYWRRPGKTDGQSATYNGEHFYVFSSNAAPFKQNEPYSPFAVYTWLNHGGDFSASTRALSAQGYGESPQFAQSATGVDISAIVEMSAHSGDCAADNEPDAPDIADPGPIPEHMFDVPGLVRQVMDFTLDFSPYPNVGLAFCGAMVLQSFLCGRKVRDKNDLRTNIYLLALAGSGTGKDQPRKVNSRILYTIGQSRCLGDKFSSGEGIEDKLPTSPCLLYQTDEIDAVLQAMKTGREQHHKSMMATLLSMFSYSNSVFPMRHKAGKSNGDVAAIDQPHVSLFGTATPVNYYESLSKKMLTNGLFARMIVIDVDERSHGQDGGVLDDLPTEIIEIAKWWKKFQPGEPAEGNLRHFHPKPVIVPYNSDAEAVLDEFRKLCDGEYDRVGKQDEVSRTVWARGNENARKLALLYACSEDHENPVITVSSAQWAREFASHQIRRMLFLAREYVSGNDFEAMCKEMLRILRAWHLRKGVDVWMPEWEINRRLTWRPRDHDDVRNTLLKQQRIDYQIVQSGNRQRPQYRMR